MATEMNIIKKSCSNLAESLIWWQIEPNHEQIDLDLDEFNEMTNKFYEIAMENYYRIEKLDKNEEIMSGAISYISRAHALPPLRGQFKWFDEILGALLEICNPNAILTDNELAFLDHLEGGIKHYRENANY